MENNRSVNSSGEVGTSGALAAEILRLGERQNSRCQCCGRYLLGPTVGEPKIFFFHGEPRSLLCSPCHECVMLFGSGEDLMTALLVVDFIKSQVDGRKGITFDPPPADRPSTLIRGGIW